jgi:hypothetical protein
VPLLYFEVYCAACGNGLCNLTTVDERNGIKVEVKPCPECLKSARSQGFDGQGGEITGERDNSRLPET